MKPIFEPLTEKSFQHRIMDSFPGVYLTTISIIQGVALGILATNTFDYIKNPALAEHWVWVRFLPYSVISFIMIILVSLDYAWFVGVFRWSPRIWDTLIPLVLGFWEVGPMFFLTDPKTWWLLTATFSFVGAAAFSNTLWHCKQPMFGQNKQAYRRTKTELWVNIVTALIGTLISILAWRLLSMKVIHGYWEILFLFPIFACQIFMIWTEEKFMKGLHSDFGFSR